MVNSYIKDFTNTYVIHGEDYVVTSPARFDSETDEIIDDLELDEAAVEKAHEMYRKENGLVSPTEIKNYRARIGLSQREFAKLLGWSPNTVALYETGAFPSESNNKMLQTLFLNDNFLNSLDTVSNKLPNVVSKKVQGYLVDQSKIKNGLTFNSDDLAAYSRVLNNTNFQQTYIKLIKTISEIKAEFPGEYSTGNVSFGHLDYTYFPFFNDYLRSKKLRFGIVLNHKTLQYELWLTGQNAKIQAAYWEMMKNTEWNAGVTSMPQYSFLEVKLDKIESLSIEDTQKLEKKIISRAITEANEIEKYLIELDEKEEK